jgi:PAS domain S-box-containing protein
VYPFWPPDAQATMTTPNESRFEVDGTPAAEDTGKLVLGTRPMRPAPLAPLSAVSNRSLLEVVCNNATVALFIMDERQRCVYMNPAAEQLTGFTLAEVRDQALHDVIHHTRPDGSPYPLSECPIDQALPQNNQEHGEEVFVHKDGHFYPVAFMASPIRDPSGKPIGTVIEVRDVTSRKEAERALHEARSRLDAALTAAEIGTFVWDVSADRLYGDANFRELFKIALESDGAAPLERFVAAIHPADRERTLSRVRETLETGRDYMAEYRIMTGGRERWVIARGRVERDAEGRIVRFPGVLLDITERKLAEQARLDITDRFERQSRLFEGLASTTPDFIYIFDLEGRFIYANRRLLEVWGRTFDEAVGKNLYELDYPRWHADMHMAELAQVIRTKRPVTGEVPFTGGSGIFGIYEYIFTPVLGPEGEVEVIAGTTRDITVRKRAEEALRQGKEVLEIALAASRTGTFRFDLGQREFVHFDDNLKHLFGFSPEKVVRVAEDFLAAVHPEDLPAVVPAVKRTIDEAVDFEMEFRVVHPDGSVHWLFDRARVMRDADGKPSYLVGACTDVTRRRQSEEAARAAAERFRFLAETMPQKIFTARPDGDVDYFNCQWMAFTGLTFDEIRDWGWTQFIHPDDLEENVRVWHRSIETGEPFQFEHRFRRHDGVYRWHLSRAEAMRDRAGNILMWIGSNTDIDDVKCNQEALRESAERLKAALDAANMGTFRWDIRSNALSWDENLSRLFGLAPGSTVESLDQFIALVHPEDLAGVSAQCGRCAQEGTDFHMEYRVVWPDGTVRWLDDKGKTVLDTQGLPLYMTGACVDITHRKRAEEERQALLEAERRARSEAEHANHLKDEFLATLSHELRTPLTAILGWSHLLRRHARQDDELGEGLSVIERNARVQVQLIEELLDMSRIMAGKLLLDVQRLDLATIVRAAIESVMPAAEAKSIRIQALLDAHVGPVRGDAARLQQVFWNIISNAIKFTPKGGRVQVALERVNSHVEITVTDTGIGIAPEFLPYVFERFRQGERATNRRHGGLGLGLAIVKSIVEMHGGTVRVKSPGVDRGATFSVELPVMVLHDDRSSPGEREHPRLSGLDAGLGQTDESLLEGICLLVVDDERDARELLRRVLEDAHARVAVAADAREALELLRRERPHVIVSDIGMPGEDGYAFIRRVRELPASEGGDTPAVALTAFARSEDRRRALIAGFQSHVAKPVEPAELVTVIASLAGRIQRASRG